MVRASWYRGGTSKGLLLSPSDLPADGRARDAMLLRIMGSPDPYCQQMDGLGGGSSSTSKVALVSAPSTVPGHDVDYNFGQVSVSAPSIDWTGSCGNLAAAVGPFALTHRLLPAARCVPRPFGPRGAPHVQVRIWQVNTRQTIVAHVPVLSDGTVDEVGGEFNLDGVTFPSSEISLEFAGGGRVLVGRPLLQLTVPGWPSGLACTLITAGNPHILAMASDLGLIGTERPTDLNADSNLLRRCETVRTAAAVAMVHRHLLILVCMRSA